MGVGNPDPEAVGCLPVTELSVGEMDTQAIPDRRIEKWPLPDRPPAIRAPEKIPSGQGDPQSLIVQPKHRANIWVSKRDEDELTGGALANCVRKGQPNQKAFLIP